MAKKVASSKEQKPKVEVPKVEEPKAETPKVETPKAETPKTEEPKAAKPKVEKPKAEKPKVKTTKVEKPKAEAPKSRGIVPMSSARAVIPAAPDCICPTCSSNDWIDTDPDDTNPPALAYQCTQCGVRHVPVVGAGASGITEFWVLRLISATKSTSGSGANVITLEVEFEDQITGHTDVIATTNAISKVSVGSLPDQVNYLGPSGGSMIGFIETGTGNSNVAKFEIQFTSVTGISIVSNIFIGFKNGEQGVILTQPNLVLHSGGDAEVSSLATGGKCATSIIEPLVPITGYQYAFNPVAGSMTLQTGLIQGSTNGTHTYTTSDTCQTNNDMELFSGDKFTLGSQGKVIVS